jgi:hypothetical protein
MAKKSPPQDAPEERKTVSIDDIGRSVQEIAVTLQRMERRDRVRTWGSMVRSTLSLLPLLIFLWSLYYVYKNGEALLQQIIRETVNQTASFAPDSQGNIFQELERFFQQSNTER